MKTLLFNFLALFLLISSCTSGQKITVDAGVFERTDCVVSIPLSALHVEMSSSFTLYDTSGFLKKKVSSQVVTEKGEESRLCWIINGTIAAGKSRNYVLVNDRATKSNLTVMQVEDTKKGLVVKHGDNPVLQYNYAITYPPTGIDSAYQRSGFMHPAWSPKGNVLTRIQPTDHYHHYGIWNPWTRVEYDEKTYDLWNLRDRKGTVRAAGIESTTAGDVFAGYVAKLDHYIFTPEAEKVIMNETWNVKAWNVSDGFLWDFKSTLSPSTALPVLIKAYRYAGFSWRATEQWHTDNTIMISYEGRDRKTIDNTTSRWIYTTGTCGENGKSGFLMMSHPTNYTFPEPLRIWDENTNGKKNNAFVNFAATKLNDWNLESGKTYNLRYRVLTYDGDMTPERAERLWNDFATPPTVSVK